MQARRRELSQGAFLGVNGSSETARKGGLASAARLTPEQRSERARRAALSRRGWKSDEVGYGAVHARLVVRRGKAAEHSCTRCNEPACDWAYDGSDSAEKHDEKRGRYSLDPACYVPMCRPCHKTYDARKELQ